MMPGPIPAPKIYVGGWARFREESGVTKTEPVEDFSWMGGLGVDYEDCREALNRVEGAREYLKSYVAVEDGERFVNFDDPIGRQIRLSDGHSGSSYSSILWSYKALLNDWDGWVQAQKEKRAFEKYTRVQIRSSVIVNLYTMFKALAEGAYPVDETKLLELTSSHGLQGTSQEIYPILTHLYTEHMARMALQAEEEERREHISLICGLKWKYKHPSRWFDTPWGSTISPATPKSITEEAYEEMERLYPGYRDHIDRVKTALTIFQLPEGVSRYSYAGEAFTSDFLSRYGIRV
jgi:hypothetical protein